MFKVYKRNIYIGRTVQSESIESQVEDRSSSGLSKILAIPAMVAGAIVGTLAFSVFFIVLLIPLGIMGFRTWRMIRTAQQSVPHTEDGSLTAEYTVVSDTDNSKNSG